MISPGRVEAVCTASRCSVCLCVCVCLRACACAGMHVTCTYSLYVCVCVCVCVGAEGEHVLQPVRCALLSYKLKRVCLRRGTVAPPNERLPSPSLPAWRSSPERPVHITVAVRWSEEHKQHKTKAPSIGKWRKGFIYSLLLRWWLFLNTNIK